MRVAAIDRLEWRDGRIRASQVSLAALLATLTFMIVWKLNGHGQLFFLGDDRFADFLKVVLALPGGPPAFDKLGLEPLINQYWHSADYRLPEFGLYHLPPLSMFLTLLARIAFEFVSPSLVFFALSALFAASLALIILRFTGDLVWAGVALVSYPLLTILDRGNLYAGLCAVCVIAALLRRRTDWNAAFLFAIALNVRPNVAILAIPLLALDWRFACRTGLAAAIIAFVSALGAHALFADYTVANFLHGLQFYAAGYADGGKGVPFGSSLYGAAYLLHVPYVLPVTLLAISPLMPALFLFRQGKMQYAEFVFVCSAVTGMATTVFADYHLLVFLAPLMLARNLRVVVPSILLLAPKGWWVIGKASVQVILNPVIMLGASWWLVYCAMRRDRSESRAIDLNQPIAASQSV